MLFYIMIMLPILAGALMTVLPLRTVKSRGIYV